MQKILVVHYSQSGQLSDVTQSFTAALQQQDDIELHFEALQPVQAYPFPWPFFQFFDTFPETVYADAPALRASTLTGDENFDLIILAYQVWFLSPSLPTSAFLQSELAAKLLRGKPVVTLIACRNMWLMAQEDVKRQLQHLDARLLANVALVDEVGSIGSFLATPAWVLTGNKEAKLGGLIPRAGVSEQDAQAASRFGERIRKVLRSGKPLDTSLLQGLGAVTIDESLIASEKAGKRSFKLWGALFRVLGPQGHWRRKPLILIYVVFLLLLILTVIPLSMLLKKILRPLMHDKLAQLRAHYAWPSGEDKA